MLITKPKFGFSLIELLIGLAIFATLLAVAFPAFTAYMQNARLLNTAEGFSTGLQLARTEAVRRNTTVDFVVLDSTTAATAASKDVTAGSTTGQNWIVRAATNTAGTFDFIDGKTVKEGAAQTIAVTVATPIVTFTSLGASTLTSAALFEFKSATGLDCQPTGDIRCMNVRVSVGGQARICDPAVTAASDTRSC